MESRLVLVIEGDDQTANRFAAAIREADYEVVVSPTAAAGIAAAVEIRPDCVICDVELPDGDGLAVARSIRAHPSPVALTPLVLLSPFEEGLSRLAGFEVGADAFVTGPFEVDEVVAQVDALVKLAARMRQRRDSMASLPPDASYGTTAIEGDVRQMSIATVLSVLGMERRTGVFEVVSKKRRAQIELAAGYVVHGTIGGTRVNALAATRLMLAWKVGRFSFRPLPPCEPPPSLRTVQALLLDAAKAEDEAAAGVPGSVRLFDGQFLGAFGGPPSRPDDTAPPSSRAMREAAAAPVSLTFDLVPSHGAADLGAGGAAGGGEHEPEALSALDREWGLPRTMPPPPRAAPTKRPPQASPPTLRTHRLQDGGMAVGEDGTISVDLGDLSEDEESAAAEAEMVTGERMLIEETPRAPMAVSRTHRVAATTPPAGMPITRAKVAIPPPPGSSAENDRPFPAPPAPPRPLPRTVGERPRPPQRANPKK
ncbi:MAG: response regulator [Polyangiaceae bacterium]